MNKSIRLLTLSTVIGLVLASCNLTNPFTPTPDPNIALTAAAMTLQALQNSITPSATANPTPCVDLSRTLKPQGITHFNICGQTDGSGNTRISTIHVYQRPEDVGLGGLLQDITVSDETLTPLNDPNSLVVEDMDQDGYDDFQITTGKTDPGSIYLNYFFIPGSATFGFSKGDSALTSNTDNCVELTRIMIQYVDTQPGPMHFSICGQTLESGTMKIATVKVYQRPEDLGFRGFSQDITLPALETSTPLNDENSLIVEDMNYDGISDFRIVEALPAGPNIPYLYFIYDPATSNFIYKEQYRKITSPEFPGNNEIRSQWRESAVRWGVDTYGFFEGDPTLTKRETWDAIDNGMVRHIIKISDFPNNNPEKVTLDEIVPLNGTVSPNLVPGTTIQHKVAAGEWLIQIARCYGADPDKVIRANPQIYNPSRIAANTMVTVPNIGSAGPIYGPNECVVTYKVQSGDTWKSIAQLYNADLVVLQRANHGTLWIGRMLIVPHNSARSKSIAVSGKIQVGEQSRMGGKAESTLTINVKFEASSQAGITDMRVKQDSSGGCLTSDAMNAVPWEPFAAERLYNYLVPINWSTFKLHVQYRDAKGNLSPVYCGEVAIEGSP